MSRIKVKVVSGLSRHSSAPAQTDPQTSGDVAPMSQVDFDAEPAPEPEAESESEEQENSDAPQEQEQEQERPHTPEKTSAKFSRFGGRALVNRTRKLESSVQALEKLAGTGDNVVRVEIKAGATVTKATLGVQHEKFKEVLELGAARENIYLYGPTGSGKTHIAEQVALAFELDFFAQSCSRGMDETVFTGRILPDEAGAYRYKPSVFVRMYEYGGVFCFDEMDKADPTVLTFLNTALSNNFLYNELDDGRRIARHKDFLMIGTANTAGHGGDQSYFSEELDLSTLRRFQTGMVYVDYSHDVEKKLCHPGVYLWSIAMREAIDECRVERLVVSTGFMLKVTRLVRDYSWNRVRWEETFFAGRNSDEVRRITERANEKIQKVRAGVAK